jgi:hypothetical protein
MRNARRQAKHIRQKYEGGEKMYKKDSEFLKLVHKHGFIPSTFDINEMRMDRDRSRISIIIRHGGE